MEKKINYIYQNLTLKIFLKHKILPSWQSYLDNTENGGHTYSLIEKVPYNLYNLTPKVSYNLYNITPYTIGFFSSRGLFISHIKKRKIKRSAIW